jgi:uncharacterized phage-associated protein
MKAVEAVLWFIKEKKVNDMYSIWKMLFEAEKYHLNKYGRPIIGETYLAMQYGTVPRWLYKDACGQYGVGFRRYKNNLYADKEFVKDVFSEVNIEALEHGYEKYAGMSFKQIENENHKELSWLKYEEDIKKGNEIPIPFEDLIEEAWLIKELEWKSQFLVL